MRYPLSLVGFLLFWAQISTAQVNVWTYHNDNARTGANTNETALTSANVNTNTFGKLFAYAMDGYVYAQPLYMTNVSIAGKGVHNVIFAATEHDSVYALDADTNVGTNATPLWQRNFLNPGAGVTTLNTNDVGTTDILPEVGITGTPVIDVAAGTLYCVAKTKEISGGITNFVQRLHALDITTGNERPNSPVVIQASVTGTGDGTDGFGHVPFNPLTENQRAGLLLLNGAVYIAWASHGDNPPYHGWVIGYNAQTLQQAGVFNATPNGSDGGIWQAGGALSADLHSNIFCITGNGTFNAASGNYGDSFLRLAATATNLTLGDYFTPFNEATLSVNDTDLGSGGALLLPDSVGSVTNQHLLVGAGKEGKVYLIDRDNFGHFNAANDNQIVQFITNAVVECLDNPAYFNNRVYYMGYKDYLKAFLVTNGRLSALPITKSPQISGIFGASPVISANGTNNAIAWILLTDAYKTQGPAVLHAFDAYDLTHELYTSAQAGTRDAPGGAVKFTLPTVVNGKVYVGTGNALAVFGNSIFTTLPIITAQPQSQTVNQGTNVTFTVGVLSNGVFTCQWLFDGTNIAGATSTNYTIPNVQITKAGNYSVIISNSAGTTTSALAALSVLSQLTNATGSISAPSGMVNWWPAEGNANDIFGPNNGTPQGNLSYVSGKTGLAFNFDGLTSYLNVGAASLAPPWTVSMWVNRQNAPNTSAILMGDSNNALKLEQYNLTRKVGITQFGIADSSYNYIAPAGVWTHLVFVGTTSNTVLYANGLSQGTLAVSFPLPRAYIGVTYIPSSSRFVDYMLGGLDELVVFNRALSGSEISAIYAADSAGMCRSPQFSSTIELGGGQFGLKLRGQTGKNFTLYSSTNLIDWTSLGSVPNPTGTTQFIDHAATNAGQKFYRASQP
jgi:hypothetical protein